MVTLQILNKVLQTQNFDIIANNGLTDDLFVGYEAEFNFIAQHFATYGKVPDKATFLQAFQDFSLVEVTETDNYLLDTLYEENLYYRSVSVIQRTAELLKTNANDAVEYLHSQLPQLSIAHTAEGIDIISQANNRYEIYNEKVNSEDSWYITTGFAELDIILNGWAKGEEFVVIFARTGEGKSWVLSKTLTHAWELGNRVGYISPEMSADKIGYRFDTLHKNFSNANLVWGREAIGYKEYIDDLQKHKNPFVVATPADFQKRVTVSKLRQFCKAYKLDVLGIDGITYLTDERFKRGDTKTISLTNISEDLMSLSLELQIPILVVVQSNRQGAKDKEAEGTPELETIRDSDGIAQNATKVLSIRQTGQGLEIGVKKHRDGASGGKVIYSWNIDKGEFIYVPSGDEPEMPVARTSVRPVTRPAEGTDVF